MNVIPQSPALEVTVTRTEYAADGSSGEDTEPGPIVAWQVRPDDDAADLIPIVWIDGDDKAFALESATCKFDTALVGTTYRFNRSGT